MYCLNVILTVRDSVDIPKVAELLTECGRRSRTEEGCIGYEACHSQSDPSLFILCERWASEADWQAHRDGAAVQEVYLPKVIPLVDRVPHVSTILE